MNHRSKQIKRSLIVASFVLLVAMVGLPTVADAIARGYKSSDSKLQIGMVAALNVSSTDSSSVERATQENNGQVIGVVTTVDNSLVTVAPGSSKVIVETEGQVPAYVSDINGVITKGDKLVVSPLNGVLMKAGAGTGLVIGLAAENLTYTTKYEYQEDGKTKETNIGKITIDLNTRGENTNASGGDSSLSKLGRALVGKPVSDVRVVTALAVFIIVLMVEGAFLYGGISTSITALGRNPMAKNVIRKELVRVCAVAFGVLLVGLAAVYAIVWI